MSAEHLQPFRNYEIFSRSKLLQMYEIPGGAPVSERMFRRYFRDKLQDDAIKNSIGKILTYSENGKTVSTEVSFADTRTGLESQRIDVLKKSAGKIIWLPENERDPLRDVVGRRIREALTGPNAESAEEILSVLYTARDSQKAHLIRMALAHPSIKVQSAAARLLLESPREERDRLKRIVFEKVKEGLQSPDVETLRMVSGMIVFADNPVPLRKKLDKRIKEEMQSSDINVRRAAVDMIWSATEDAKQELFELAVQNGVGDDLIKPKLYKQKKYESNGKLLRQRFEKSGSKTTLLYGTLKNKVIVRHLLPEAFLSWQKAFESFEEWKKAGFDYVPIEPIHSFRLRKSGLVDVYSGVLDLNLEDWVGVSNWHLPNLSYQLKRIDKVVQDLRIHHGHPQDSNLCLRFFRDNEGNADLKRAPHLYLIDFDQADFF